MDSLQLLYLLEHSKLEVDSLGYGLSCVASVLDAPVLDSSEHQDHCWREILHFVYKYVLHHRALELSLLDALENVIHEVNLIKQTVLGRPIFILEKRLPDLFELGLSREDFSLSLKYLFLFSYLPSCSA